ncbi:hypothetical protein [Corynebacterium matruchotii]
MAEDRVISASVTIALGGHGCDTNRTVDRAWCGIPGCPDDSWV